MALGIGSLSPEDFEALLRAAPPGGAAAPQRIPFGINPALLGQGSEGASQTAGGPSFGPGSQMPSAPQMPPMAEPTPTPRLAPAGTPHAPRAIAAAPMPPERPAELGAGAADMPTPDAVPTSGKLPDPTAPAAPAAPAGGPEKPGMGVGDILGKLGDAGIGDQMLAFASGLGSTAGFGPGMSAGFKSMADASQKRAVTDLARTKAVAEQQEAARKAKVLTGNASYVKDVFAKQGRQISDDQAMAFGSNQGVMTDLFKGVLPPTETYRQEKDAEGNTLNVNERTGQKAVLTSAKEDKSYTPLSEQERVERNLPPGAYQKDANGKVGPVNPTGTTINMGGEKAYDAEVGKTYAKQFTDLQTSGRNASAKLNSLALMEQQMTKPDYYSGVGGEQVKRLNQFLGAVGIKDPKAASPAEVVDALSNQVVLDQLGGSLGAGISDSDRKTIALIGPGIAKTPEGNRQLIGIYRSVAQREQQISQMARDYAKKNGGRIDAGFDDQVAQFAASNPLFPAAEAAATAQSDGKTGGTGPNGIAAPQTQAEFDALPMGAVYTDPGTGKRYRK